MRATEFTKPCIIKHSEGQKEAYMTKEEKLEKVCSGFSRLSGEKQDRVLGIVQALVFAKDEMGTDQPVEADENNTEGASL
jgi:hypothetical protein